MVSVHFRDGATEMRSWRSVFLVSDKPVVQTPGLWKHPLRVDASVADLKVQNWVSSVAEFIIADHS